MLFFNVSKSEFMVLHMPQKHFNIPTLNINSTEIQLIAKFNPYTADVAKRRHPGRLRMSPFGDKINYFF